MKKLTKLISLILLIGITFIVGNITVNASAPNSIVVTNTRSLQTYIGTGKIGVKKLADGTVVYCLDLPKKNPQGVTLYRKGELDAGMAWLIENGWPNKSFTGDADKDAYLMQAAVWWYLDDTAGMSNLTYKFKNEYADPYGLKNHIYALLDGAKQAKNRGYVEPTISLNTSSVKLHRTNDYYESDLITLTGNKLSGNYTVSAKSPNGSVTIVDENGKNKSSFNINDKFRVRLYYSKDIDVKITINASATGFINKAYRYESSDGVYQPSVISILYPDYKEVKTSIELTGKNTSVSISKKDVTTKNELPGAHLVVKDSNGKTIDEWISTDKAHIITGIAPGKYTLTETIAPKGYILSKESITFEVKDDGSVTPVIMYNTKSSSISISKQDITTKKELPGAHLVVKDSNGKVIDEWVSTTEPHVINDVEPGKYTLTETIAPNGYELSNETITFEVKADGGVTPVTMYNTKETVDVPITDSNISPIIYILGITLIIGSSLKLVKYARN